METKHKPFSSQMMELIDDEGSGAEIARKCGVSESVVRKWRDGVSSPKLEHLLDLAQGLGVNLHWLATGEGEKYPKSFSYTALESDAESSIESIPVQVSDGDISRAERLPEIQRKMLISARLRRSRELLKMAVDVTGWEPEPPIAEAIKSMIFRFGMDIESVTQLLDAIRRERS